MTEKNLEKKIIDALDAAFTAAGVSGVQFVGAWQPAAVGEIKAQESLTAVLTVKVQPRSYSTFTMMECEFPVAIQLDFDAGDDPDGEKFLAAADVVASVLGSWHKSYNAYFDAFEIPDEFLPTGMVLGGGDAGIDRTAKIWTYSPIFTLQGVILN